MEEELKNKLIFLADKYENDDFLAQDPSQFLRWYKDKKDIEIACFIAALLSFGNRKQFIPKIKFIFELADKQGGMFCWVKNKKYLDFFEFETSKENEKKFYRFYSYEDMKILFDEISFILNNYENFGSYIFKLYNEQKDKEKNIHLSNIICNLFAKSKIVPKGKNSANKRIHMYLRWMVRSNSKVDLGIWDWYNAKDLIIPLDTHVIQQSIKLGLIKENASSSLKTAIEITTKLKEIWPLDPCKGDFALFGLGAIN